jgi:hypothetical protein
MDTTKTGRDNKETTMAKYRVTMSDNHSHETFASKRAALTFARKVKDDHGGAAVYKMAGERSVAGDDLCLARWTRGEDRKVRKINC